MNTPTRLHHAAINRRQPPSPRSKQVTDGPPQLEGTPEGHSQQRRSYYLLAAPALQLRTGLTRGRALIVTVDNHVAQQLLSTTQYVLPGHVLQ